MNANENNFMHVSLSDKRPKPSINKNEEMKKENSIEVKERMACYVLKLNKKNKQYAR